MPGVNPEANGLPAEGASSDSGLLAGTPDTAGAPANGLIKAAEAVEAAEPKQLGNPLHGITLETIVTALAAEYGWPGLGERIALRCFTSDPSVASSLKFLRKTPWAREKVESLYLFMLREQRRQQEYQRHDAAVARKAKARSATPSDSGE